MVVKVTKSGMRIHEPPYTKAEEDELYRRVGPVAVYRSTDARKAPKSPKQQQPSPAKPRSAQ